MLTSLRKTGGAFVIYNVLFSIAIPGIDLSAHLGGLVAGFALGATVVAPLTDQGAQSRVWRSILAGLVGLILIGGAVFALRAV